jgi:hypothetical protein
MGLQALPMSSVAGKRRGAPIWHSEPEKKGRCESIGAGSRELPRETRFGLRRISTKLWRLRRLMGIFDDFVS